MGLGGTEKPNTKGDRVNMVIIYFMFILEGVVQGIVSALPIVLENRKASFDDQGEFSMTAWPSCLKLPWAPIVDCVYSKKFGRRKTWLIPVQYLMGMILLFASMNLDDWLGSEDGTRLPNVHALSAVFGVAMFLNSLQDISLDGWTLNMLQKRNVGYVALCQNTGGLTGYISCYVLFIILDSKDFCNKFRSVPRDYGFVSLADFLLIWSVVFFVSTTIILFFKKENSSLESTNNGENESSLSLMGSYKLLWRIFNIRPIIMTSLILFTASIGFGPQNGVAPLKIIEAGVPREDLVLFSVLVLPLHIILSSVFRRRLTGPRALSAFLLVQILILIIGVSLAAVLFSYSNTKNESGLLPERYYWTILFLFIAKRVIQHQLDVTISGFGCRISDPRFGGIYLTLVWAMASAGRNWPTTLSLYCADWLTIKTCTGNEMENCSNFDGFYTETILFTVLAALWLLCWCRKEIHQLEKLEASAWIVEKKHEATGENTNRNLTVCY